MATDWAGLLGWTAPGWTGAGLGWGWAGVGGDGGEREEAWRGAVRRGVWRSVDRGVCCVKWSVECGVWRVVCGVVSSVRCGEGTQGAGKAAAGRQKGTNTQTDTRERRRGGEDGKNRGGDRQSVKSNNAQTAPCLSPQHAPQSQVPFTP